MCALVTGVQTCALPISPVRVSAMAVASAVLMLTLSAANALAVSTSDSNNDLARMAIDFMGFLLLGCRRHAADGVDRLTKRAGRRYHHLSYSPVSLDRKSTRLNSSH